MKDDPQGVTFERTKKNDFDSKDDKVLIKIYHD